MNTPETKPEPLPQAQCSASEITATDLKWDNPDTRYEETWEEDEYCDRCGGSGEILVCCDDICHGLGECIHGDGYAVCPDCKGRG